ncbi:MAG: glutamate mutase L, partial [Marmoricola sp.]
AGPLLAAAAELAGGRWRGPVVVGGNADARDEAVTLLRDAGLPVAAADNVLPRIGVLAPESARRAIRETFLAHVIGGKQLSADPEFARMVRGATPDVVLTGVELLADAAGLPRGLVVVDVGGATTDVHSVVRMDAETAELRRDVVAVTPVTRTVEGDLGMRWSAAATARSAVEAGLADPALVAEGERRTADPGLLPGSDADRRVDDRLATAAVTLAVRRHAGRATVVLSPEGRVVERSGVDLREVDLLVGSGGVLRAAGSNRAGRILAGATGGSPDGWQQPRAPELLVDRHHVLAAVGLLAAERPGTAARLARSLLA